MRKPPTGEPCAGEPHARFGGRAGRRKSSRPLSSQAAALSALVRFLPVQRAIVMSRQHTVLNHAL